jgi:outer membrane protein OmpA-like peptidoglycan-associated protein/tetratricopeptide (TPR) repeat protein
MYKTKLKMRNFYITFGFVILTATINAQSKATKKADKLYSRYEYVAAAENYLKLTESGNTDPYVYKQLADTYYNMFNAQEATKWYAKATQTAQDAETYYRYAQMLKASKQYEASNLQMQKFVKMQPNDLRAKAFVSNPDYANKIAQIEQGFTIKNLDVNTDKSEFGGVLYDNSFYYASARNTTQKDYGWDKEPFLDIYKSDYNTDGTFMNATAIAELNTQYHDGPVSISAEGKTIYFSSDSFREKSFVKDKKNKLKLSKNNLFKATSENGKWTNITPLPFNSNSYSTSNPSISRDGKTLYFSSDMPGSIGGVDIWKTTINADGTYGTPQNLGTSVNTEGTESFPFIADDNTTLYFASSGRQGLGGLDVYQVDVTKQEPALNVGQPINTETDDFSFTFNKAKNIGFFSSNRTGNDEIYGALPICTINLITQVMNEKTGEPLANSKVAVVDAKKVVLATTQTNEKGTTSYRVPCDKDYSLQISKDGYLSDVYQIAKSTQKSITTTAKLKPIEPIITETEVILQPIYFEYNKSNITQEGAVELDKLVTVLNDNPKLVILAKSHTDNRGNDQYNLNLSDRRAKSTVQYIISKGIDQARISGKGFGETELKVACGEACTEEEHAQNRRSEFLIVK